MSEQRFGLADVPKQKLRLITDDDPKAEQLTLLVMPVINDFETRLIEVEKKLREIETMLRDERDNLHG